MPIAISDAFKLLSKKESMYEDLFAPVNIPLQNDGAFQHHHYPRICQDYGGQNFKGNG